MPSFKIRFSNGDVKPVSDVPLESTVEETKAILQSLGICDVAVDQQRLIFKGRILANELTLQEAGVQEGSTVHFVKASAKPASAPAPSSAPPTPAAAAAPTVGGGGGGGFADLFGGGGAPGAGGNEAQGRMMMNLLQSNPGIRNMMERNPEVARMLNSPEAMQQMLQMNNPAMRDEILRNHDRQLANLESIPGGQAALLRMMNEVGDVDSVFDQTPSQPTVTRPNASPPANGRPEAAPMPNPWSSAAPAPAPTAQRQTGSNPWAPGGGSGGGLGGGLGEMPDMRAMQQMMQQPAMRQRMEEMTRNPEMMQQQMQMMQQMLGNEGMAQLHQRAMQMMSQPGAMEELQRMGGPPAPGANPFAAFAANNANSSNNNQSLEVRFADQLSQLEGMGFTNRAQNVRALVATNGNVHAAVERLLM